MNNKNFRKEGPAPISVRSKYRKPPINTANGSSMFSVLFESLLIKVKNNGD